MTELPNIEDLVVYKFDGPKGFFPHYTPRDMQTLGVFDGDFFKYISTREGLPSELWQGIASENYFEVSVSHRSRMMEIPTMIRMIDPKGWFQWYCRFYYGRRILGDSSADQYRVNQWRKEVVTLFHYIKFGIPPDGYEGDKITDLDLFPEYRQQLLHFGYDSRIDPLSLAIIL